MTGAEQSHTEHSGKSTLQGWVPNLADPAELFKALDQAFDYRGDVTLTLRDGRTIEGFIYDRRRGQGLADSVVRMMPANSEHRMNISYADIAGLQFSGKDTAHGKTWENWLKRYVEKKTKGEKASLEAEKLD
jgi:hypothetical protein